MLQAYALKEIVLQMGCECQIVDYKTKQMRKRYELFRGISFIKKNIFKNPLKALIACPYYLITFPIRVKKWARFSNFSKEYLKPYPTIRNIAEFEKIQNDFDTLILGSDQIWNPKLCCNNNMLDAAYFGFFKTRARVIAYAASMGQTELTGQDEQDFIRYLSKVDNISVRENNAKKYIQSLTKKGVTHVLDPTLFFDEEFWSNIAILPKEKKPFLLVYTLEDDEKFNMYAEEIAKRNNLKIIDISPKCFRPKRKGFKGRYTVGPAEFIGYIKNASIIISNSYHCTLFSIIYKKEFYVTGVRETNSRFNSLLNQLNLKDRFVSQKSHIETTFIDYERVSLLLEEQQKISFNFLKNNVLQLNENYKMGS